MLTGDSPPSTQSGGLFEPRNRRTRRSGVKKVTTCFTSGLALVALLVTVVATITVLSQGNVRLLRPGTHLIKPPPLQSGQQWFGLQHSGERWELVKVVPKIVPARAICGDYATQIAVDGIDGLLFLVSGVPNLSAGPVAATIDKPRFLYPGEAVEVGQAGDDDTLEARGTAIREEGGVVFTNYTLWFRHGRQTQRVAVFQRNTLDHPRQLMWAGDLNRDGRPDFLFDFPLGDVGNHYVLFLSSSDGQLLSKVATFSTPGC